MTANCHRSHLLSCLANGQRYLSHSSIDLALLLLQIVQRIGQTFELVISFAKALLGTVFLLRSSERFRETIDSFAVLFDLSSVGFPILKQDIVCFELGLVSEGRDRAVRTDCCTIQSAVLLTDLVALSRFVHGTRDRDLVVMLMVVRLSKLEYQKPWHLRGVGCRWYAVSAPLW